MKLSIVDQSPVSEGSTPADALRNSIELGRLADRLGYERYWIAEHHGMDTLASPAPEILIARIAAETSRIRVGSGAVLLPHYSPLKVAEVFRMLHALYPDRIDLGVGRAPGGTALEARALRKGLSADVDTFPDDLLELLAYLENGFPPGHPFGKIKVAPQMPGGPEVWLLGSSPWSATAAAQLGSPYAFAHFIDPQYTRQAIERYRSEFHSSERLKNPRVILALGALCAETEEEARHLAASARALLRRFRTFPRAGGLVPTAEQAIEELSTGLDPSVFESGEWPRYAVGTAARLREKLSNIADELKVDEMMIVTIVHSHNARLRSYELLAKAFI
ncbi:MAG: LLM class flavin-dependent oxidoreductase [Acidobacteriota bacterium]|nr:LLM class flavin-dependent oxidoreductase [Acidobacteriota bacterium]